MRMGVRRARWSALLGKVQAETQGASDVQKKV
jgi:hypothetical protein